MTAGNVTPGPPFRPGVTKDGMSAKVRAIVICLLAFQVLWAPDTVRSQQDAPVPPLPKSPTEGKAQDQLDFADGLYERKMYLEAAEEYAEFIQSFPEHDKIPTALFRRAECLYQQAFRDRERRRELFEDAERNLRTLLEKFPQNSRRTEALLRRGEILCDIGRPGEAIPLFEELLKGSLPKSVEEPVRFYLAQAYWDQKKANAAEKEWETLRERFPQGRHFAPATYSLALLKRQKGQLDTAISLLKELAAEDRSFPLPEGSTLPSDARVVMADIYRQLEEHEKAAQMYLEASRDPRHRMSCLYGRAWALFQSSDFKGTAGVCRELLKESGLGDREAGTLFLLGTALYETQDYQEAVDPLKKVVNHPDAEDFRTQAWYRLVWSLFLTKNYGEASVHAKALLNKQIDPALAGDIHFVLAEIAAAAKKYSEAAAGYRTVVEQYSGSRFQEKALYGLGSMHYRAGEYEQASKAFEKFMEQYPGSPLFEEAMRWSAESLLQAGQHEEATIRISQLIERNPSHPDLPNLLYRQGLGLLKSGREEEMRKPFEKILAEFPQSSHAPEALYMLAWQDDQAGNEEEALQEYARLVRDYPGAAKWEAARQRVAVGYMKTGQFDRAMPIFAAIFEDDEEAAKIGPEVYFEVAIHASERGRHDVALRVLRRVAEVHTRDEVLERALIEQGRELVALQEWQEASDCANRFLQKFPNSQFQPEAHWIRARSLQGQNHYDDAAKAFEKSLQTLANMGSPDKLFQATLHLDRGKLLQTRGQPEQALKEFLYVDILFPDPRTSPEALLHASQCQEELGREEEARKSLEQLISQYPESSQAGQAQVRLRYLQNRQSSSQ